MSGQDLSSSKLALQVSRRQKRLTYWREQFSAMHSAVHPADSAAGVGSSVLPPTEAGVDRLSKDARDRVEELFQTYQLLLTRLVRSATTKNASEIEESERRLAALDRELTTLFEARRLLTSELGASAISS